MWAKGGYEHLGTVGSEEQNNAKGHHRSAWGSTWNKHGRKRGYIHPIRAYGYRTPRIKWGDGMTVAKRIHNSINDLIVACETIRNYDSDKEYDACKVCPLKDHCLEEVTLEAIAYHVDVNSINLMLNMAETITERLEERAKTEEQRRWEAEADYWNDRRCDPDDYDE